MKWVKKRIQTASSREIDIVVQTVVSWHKQQFPDYELVVWSKPVDNKQERKRQIDMVMRYLNQWDEKTKR